MARTYDLDPDRSVMSFDGRSSLHPIRADTRGLTGWIRADGEALEAGELEIPLGTLSAGNPLYDNELRRRIDIRRHPTATAVLGRWDPATRRASGSVSFRGVTIEAEDELTVSMEDDDTLLVEGSRTFDIRDFGMQPPRLVAVRVHPEVTIRIALVALARR
jgi:polyisoprenoid-binding protein YceI